MKKLMFESIGKLRQWLESKTALPDDTENDRQRKVVGLGVTLTGILATAVWVVIFYRIDLSWLGLLMTLASLALDMRDYVNQHDFLGQRLNIRIGLNSGSVVAGVIGRRKFIYDLWGDAVNIASRMESHRTGGMVQITEAAYERIRENFICEPQGMINVKGKGEMKVWHVLNRGTV